MKIKDIVEESALLLQLEDVLSLPEFANGPYATVNPKSEVGPLTQRTLKLLVRCANFALRLIATNYMTQKISEKIKTQNGEIKFSCLSHDCLEITKIENSNGEIAFKTYPTFVNVFKQGEYEVFYNFIPSIKGFNEEITDFSPHIKKEIVAYLACCEYCLISSLNDEAQSFDVRFKDAMRKILKTKGGTVKERRWF